MIVQIYSMTSIADSVATAGAGADLVGVVVAEPGVVAEAIDAGLAREVIAAASAIARNRAHPIGRSR
jgi:hypothetical protein